MASAKRLVLASASPRRRELLARVGVAFDVTAADIDESHQAGELPMDYTRRMATSKAAAVAKDFADRWVLGADTIVLIEGNILGKPENQRAAHAMLERLCGATHQVLSAVCLLAPGGKQHVFCATTDVTMRSLEDSELDAYVKTGEWRGKAGGYAVQGIGSSLVSEVRGSYTNVVGLPLAEVVAEFRRTGAIDIDFASGDAA